MSRLRCRLFGHQRPFVSRVLPESSTLSYGYGLRVGYRNEPSQAVSWPTCQRCGEMFLFRLPREGVRVHLGERE